MAGHRLVPSESDWLGLFTVHGVARSSAADSGLPPVSHGWLCEQFHFTSTCTQGTWLARSTDLVAQVRDTPGDCGAEVQLGVPPPGCRRHGLLIPSRTSGFRAARTFRRRRRQPESATVVAVPGTSQPSSVHVTSDSSVTPRATRASQSARRSAAVSRCRGAEDGRSLRTIDLRGERTTAIQLRWQSSRVRPARRSGPQPPSASADLERARPSIICDCGGSHAARVPRPPPASARKPLESKPPPAARSARVRGTHPSLASLGGTSRLTRGAGATLAVRGSRNVGLDLQRCRREASAPR